MGVLLLVRHGQASFGTEDYDRLSDLGAEQARRLGARLRGQPVDRVVVGAMLRQQQTARHLLESADLDASRAETDARWDEYDASGVLARHLPPGTGDAAAVLADRRQFQALLDEALTTWTGGADGYAEAWEVFRDRVRAAFEEAAGGPGTTLVVSSAGSIAVVAAALLDLPAAGWATMSRVMVNASLTKVVTGRSGTSLLTLNDHAHLEQHRDLITYR